MADFVKAILDGLDKITDILNVGRLIFYTSAGFFGVLPVSMVLRLLAADTPAPYYWKQFAADLITCSRKGEVWLAALIFGFVVANIAYAAVSQGLGRPAREPNESGLAFQYPRLSSGGGQPKAGSDYAQWWISEFYRYTEIAVYIPYALLLSLPLYALYSLVYMIRVCDRGAAFVLGPHDYAFALWSMASVVAWRIVWPRYWIPRVAEPICTDSSQALVDITAGLSQLTKDQKPADPAPAPPAPSAEAKKE